MEKVAKWKWRKSIREITEMSKNNHYATSNLSDFVSFK